MKNLILILFLLTLLLIGCDNISNQINNTTTSNLTYGIIININVTHSMILEQTPNKEWNRIGLIKWN